MPHRFSPPQANKTLPLVRRIVADILELGGELRSLAPRRDEPESAERIQELQTELRALMGELNQIGCTYKDFGFEVGLVDFPATIDGEDVLLCWRSDEEIVGHYHGYEDGFAGRRPIPKELLDTGS